MTRFNSLVPSKVVVGVAFDDTQDHLLQTIKPFVKRLKMHMHLTHVVHSWVDHPLMVSFPAGYYSYTVASSIDKEELDNAEKKLKKLAHELQSEGYSVTCNVVLGAPAQGLISEALSEKAAMIVTSTHYKQESKIWRGFSTALTLFSESKTPVMVIPHNSKVDLSKESLTLMISDDFTYGSDCAIEIGVDLAVALGKVQVIHAHVGDYPEDQLKKVGEKILQAMNLGQLPYNKKFQSTEFIAEAKEQIAKKLADRFHLQMPGLELKGCKIKSIVGNGEPEQEIQKIAKEYKTDTIIFGQHEFMHRQPFHLGKVPFSAMLEMGTPCIMAPALRRLA